MPHLVADLSGEMSQIFTDQQPRADVTYVLIATSMVWRNMVMSQCCLSPGKLMTGPGNVQMRGVVQRQYCPIPRNTMRYNTVLYFMNISSRKRLKVPSRYSPPFSPLSKRDGSMSKELG